MAANTPPLQFFDLPPELREQIYREILSSANSKIILDEGYARYHFDLAILSVSRQIYIEAQKVFRENLFVKIMTPWPEATRHISAEGKVPILATEDKAKDFNEHQLLVKIDASMGEGHSMLICGDDLESFTQMWQYSDMNNQGLNSHLFLQVMLQDPHDPDRKLPKRMQNQLLLPFRLVKGLNYFAVQGPKVLQSVKDALAELQAVPNPTPEECLEKCTSLKDAGNVSLQAGSYHHALQQYIDAFAAIYIMVSGRTRTVHADGYFMKVLESGIYKDQHGQTARVALRVRLVANIVLVYLKLKEWEEAYFWGRRTIVILWQHFRPEHGYDNENWIGDIIPGYTASPEIGKIFFRTAQAAKEMGKTGEFEKLVRHAAQYLPRDETVQKELRTFQPLLI